MVFELSQCLTDNIGPSQSIVCFNVIYQALEYLVCHIPSGPYRWWIAKCPCDYSIRSEVLYHLASLFRPPEPCLCVFGHVEIIRSWTSKNLNDVSTEHGRILLLPALHEGINSRLSMDSEFLTRFPYLCIRGELKRFSFQSDYCRSFWESCSQRSQFMCFTLCVLQLRDPSVQGVGNTAQLLDQHRHREIVKVKL